MSSCDNLIDELRKCLLNKQNVNIKEVIVQQKPALFDNLDTEYNYIKTNIYELNNKLFNCKNNSIKEHLLNYKLEITSENYPNIHDSYSKLNNITINKSQNFYNK